MSISPNEAKRYARQIILKNIGGAGQQKLKNAKILIVGMGALGTPALAYLAASGVGTIGIIDFDKISLSNLHRQIIYKTNDIGSSKVLKAKIFVQNLNPEIKINTYDFKIEEENAVKIIDQYDMVLDCLDSLKPRLLISEIAKKQKKYLISGAVSMLDGQVSVFAPYLKDKNNQYYPSFCDLYPKNISEINLPSCEEVGVVGATTGIISNIMAMQTIKLITNIGNPLIGRLLLYDGLNCKFSEFKI